MNKRLIKKLEKQIIRQCKKITLNENDVLLAMVNPNNIKPEECKIIADQLHNIFKDNKSVVFPDFINIKNVNKENVIKFLENCINKLKGDGRIIMDNKNTRKAKVLINKKWIDIDPIDLKTDMLFKMYEEDGTPVYGDDKSIFKATEDAFYDDNGVITIGIELVE